jgi:hypothetical protein
MDKVHVLHHVNEKLPGEEDVKLIGVYSSRAKAEEAIRRLALQPGFREAIEGFEITTYQLDKDNWTEGFVTVKYRI